MIATRTHSSFTKDGKHIILLPQNEPEMMDAQAKKEAIVLHAIFIQDMREAPLGITLVVLENGEIETPTLDEVQPVLAKFLDVMMGTILAGLPPLQDIQNAIDYIPKSVLSNITTYPMRPTEYEELQ